MESTHTGSLTEALSEDLDTLDRAGLRRSLKTVVDRDAGRGLESFAGLTLVTTPASQQNSQDPYLTVIDFCSNDYLGLASDPRISEAMHGWPAGAKAARLISGNHEIHEELESAIADLKGTETALLFPTGYMANIGAIPALAGRQDVIYADELNHASLIDGCKLARGEFKTFEHLNTDMLRDMLSSDSGKFRRSWIVVDSVFSMDGDLFPLDKLVSLAQEFGVFTYVDDAHGTGVLGATGKGATEHFGVEVDVLMGTLGKAIGTMGAFIAGSSTLRDYLMNRARAFVYTTASSPALAAATIKAIEIAQSEPWRREKVRANAKRLRGGLGMSGDSHIIPVMIGDSEKTVLKGKQLLGKGFLVGAVRPPTVPMGSARLRITVSATHTDEQIDALLAELV
jgi:8-amino-7-oxononanoate synthase